MSKVAVAFTNFWVMRISSWLGVRFPEGWLWAKIMALAPNSMALFKAKRTSTTVWLIPPLLKHFFFNKRLDRLRYKIQNSSWGIKRRVGAKNSCTKVLELNCFFSSSGR